MTETKETPQKFLGTYFDRDMVMRLARWAQISAWVILSIYLLTWLISLGQFLIQFRTGLFYNKGMGILDVMNFFTPLLLQPLPGILYFFSLQGIAHFLNIFMDVEENTRRAARSK